MLREREPCLCSVPDADGSHYGDTPTIMFESAVDETPSPHEYPDLSQIRTEDLMFYAEPSQSLSQLIDQANIEEQALQAHQVLPDLEEHDKGGLNFELNLEPQQKGKLNWLFSKEYNKVYIKLNDIFNIDVLYTPRSYNEKLFMRIMMVFNAEVSEPVVRCENHSSKDSVKEKNIKHSVLRCENPNVSYVGTVEGKNVADRLSVLVPLGCVQPNEDNLVKQTIALKFVCQNSCVGRRETAIIFCLENAKQDILSKRITSVKICSCPKRDMKKDESAAFPKKRGRKDECPVGKKIMKLESDIKVEVEKEREDENDSFPSASDANDIVVTQNGFKLTLDLPDLDATCHVAECASNSVAGQLQTSPDNPILLSKFRALQKINAKVQQLREQLREQLK